MQQPNLIRAITAGFVGTVVMSMLSLMAPMMGMPEMNIAKMLGDFMRMPSVVGWIAHFMIGVIWAIVFAYFFAAKLPGAPWLKGVLFSLGPWFLMQIMASPMMGMGVFFSSSSTPMMMVVGSLLGHVVYGAVVGGIYGSTGSHQTVPASSH